MDIKRLVRVISVPAIALLLLAVMVGCSMTQRVLKTGDPDLMYSYAKELYEAEEWNKASTLFEAAEPYFSGAMCEDSLLFFNARCKYKSGDFDTAILLLDEFRRRFGRSVFLEDAEGMYTLGNYYMAPSARRDKSLITSAIIAINEFVSRYPESEQRDIFVGLREELEGRLHEKSFMNAFTYYKIGKYKSAIVAFKSAKKEYPNSTFREEISYYSVASAYELASNSVHSKKEDRFMQMLDTYYTFIAEFPESQRRKEVDLMLNKAEKYIAKQKELRASGEETTDEQSLTSALKREARLEARQERKDSKERRAREAEIEKAKELEGESNKKQEQEQN